MLLLSMSVCCGCWRVGAVQACAADVQHVGKSWIHSESTNNLLQLQTKCIQDVQCRGAVLSKLLSSLNDVVHKGFKILGWCVLLWSSFCFAATGGAGLFLEENMSKKSGNVVEWVLRDLWDCCQESGRQRQRLEEAWLLGRAEAGYSGQTCRKKPYSTKVKLRWVSLIQFHLWPPEQETHTEKLLGQPGHLAPAWPLCILAGMLWLKQRHAGICLQSFLRNREDLGKRHTC